MKPGATVIVNQRAGQGLQVGQPLTVVECLTRDSAAWGFGDYRLRTAGGRDVWLYEREIRAGGVMVAA